MTQHSLTRLRGHPAIRFAVLGTRLSLCLLLAALPEYVAAQYLIVRICKREAEVGICCYTDLHYYSRDRNDDNGRVAAGKDPSFVVQRSPIFPGWSS